MRWALLLLGVTVTSCFAQADARSGIDKLHQKDVAATLSGDPQALTDLFTEDAVLLEQGSAPQIGKAAILAENLKEKREHPNAHNTVYKPVYKDLQVVGDWAFEWAEFDAGMEENGKSTSFRGRGLRVLRREANGDWKFARVMWNTGE